MKKLVFVTQANVVATATVAVAGVHIVGGTPNANDPFPFWGVYEAFRWQTMWFQSELNEAGPVTKIEWQTADSTGGGSYNNCDILLCHTGISAITNNFANNYGGKTPIKVFNGAFRLSGAPRNKWVSIVRPWMVNFTYNNTDNLLLEVSWQGGSGGANAMWVRTNGSNFPGSIWNPDSKTATTGYLWSNYHHYARITIGYVGVDATSLGRVKALFR